MPTSLDDTLIGSMLWMSLAGSALVPLSSKNFWINLSFLTFIIPNMIGFLSRRSRFIISKTVLLAATLLTMIMTWMFTFFSKDLRDAITDPGQDKEKTLKNGLLIIMIFAMSIFAVTRVLNLYDDSNFV